MEREKGVTYMTDKKDKPEDAKTGTEKESKSPPSAKDAFDAVADLRVMLRVS